MTKSVREKITPWCGKTYCDEDLSFKCLVSILILMGLVEHTGYYARQAD